MTYKLHAMNDSVKIDSHLFFVHNKTCTVNILLVQEI